MTGNGNGNEDDEGGVESDGDIGNSYLEDDNSVDDEDDDLVESEYDISDGVSEIEVIPIIEVKDNVREQLAKRNEKLIFLEKNWNKHVGKLTEHNLLQLEYVVFFSWSC